MTTLKELMPILNDNIGKHILLGGMGILDGMKNPTRMSCDRIMGVSDGKPYFKRYGCKTMMSIANPYYWDQEARIVEDAEYRKLPKW